MKPLFIPLKTEYFNQFKDGTKTVEYRRYGARWNKEVCTIGREVTLSKGYGNYERMKGVVVGFSRMKSNELPADLSGRLGELFGEGVTDIAAIEIEVKNDQ